MRSVQANSWICESQWKGRWAATKPLIALASQSGPQGSASIVISGPQSAAVLFDQLKNCVDVVALLYRPVHWQLEQLGQSRATTVEEPHAAEENGYAHYDGNYVQVVE